MSKSDGVRCTKCGKKYGEKLDGAFQFTCIRCGEKIIIQRKDRIDKLSIGV